MRLRRDVTGAKANGSPPGGEEARAFLIRQPGGVACGVGPLVASQRGIRPYITLRRFEKMT